MDKIKVLSVFGTRPEATKMCPLAKELQKHDMIDSRLLLTGQHRQMLDSVMDFFGLKAEYDLDLMKPGQTLSDITCGVIDGVGRIVREKFRPDLILVHGDTTTSFAAALGAFYEKVDVGHVEAGLRTYDRYSPFPEEMNRTLTSRLALLHFAPTEHSAGNLRREGIKDNIFVTGNTGLDALRYTVKPDYSFRDGSLRGLDLTRGRLIVMTAHRRENLGEGIASICRAVKRITEKYPDVSVIYPVHLNPAVRNTVFPLLGGVERVRLCEPLEVDDMHNLMARACLCLTDSGGLQEEAPALGLPVLVLRSETERPEAAEAGTVKVVGTDEDRIVSETSRLLDDTDEYRRMKSAKNPYGDGHASEKIARCILEYYGASEK